MSPANVPPWGVPWHGRVQGGVLTLPNGATLAWPQPDGTASGTIPDQAGYTFRQKLPGVAAVVRTPEELAADQADGREWRDTFIVAGTDTASSPGTLNQAKLHGKAVGGWIYAAPGGSRWLVKGTGTYSFSQGGSLSIPLRLVRFDDLGGTPVTISLTASASSSAMGQLTPSVGAGSCNAKVEDITPAGDKAIVMLYVSGKAPVGFLLLTLTGTPGVDFAAVLTVLKTRAETLGVVSNTQGASATPMVAYHEFTTTTDDHCAASNYKDTIYTPTAYVRPPEWWQAANVHVGSGENRLTLTGRVMAMWFDGAGVPQPLLLDSVQSYAFDAPMPINTVSGRVVGRAPCTGSGGTTWLEYMTTTRAQAVSETVTQTLTLSYAGQQVTAEYVHVRASSMESQSTDLGGVISAPPMSQSGASTDSRLVTIDSQQVYGYSNASAEYSHFDALGSPVEWSMPPTNIPNLRDVVVSANSPVTWIASVKRWSNNLIGVRADRSGGGAFTYSPAHTPNAITQPIDPVGVGHYGSWNPITGEAVFPSATPVSWT